MEEDRRTAALLALRLWRANLLRDMPRRIGRIGGLLAVSDRIRQLPHFAGWVHGFVCYLFDLLGGPEIIQAVLRLGTRTRRLQRDEIAAATTVLGPEAVRYQDVRLARGGILDTAFRLNKNRAFTLWHTISLPAGREGNIPLLVHELTHVYQYERLGTVYIGQALWQQRQLGRGAYDYGGPQGLAAALAAGKRLADFNREQQGQIAQDFCARLRAGEETVYFEPFIAELRIGRF